VNGMVKNAKGQRTGKEIREISQARLSLGVKLGTGQGRRNSSTISRRKTQMGEKKKGFSREVGRG